MNRLTVLLPLILTACGGPFVEGDYQGEPLLTVQGSIFLGQGQLEAARDIVRVQTALFWVNPADPELEDLQVLDQQQVQASADLPTRYRIDVFRVPTGIARTPIGGAGDSYSVAAIVLFDDKDRDGTKDRNEDLIGGSGSHVVLHTTTGVTLGPGLDRLAPGFHLMAIEQPPTPVDMVNCVEDEDRQLELLHPADAGAEDVDLVIEPGEDDIIPETECEGEDDDDD